MAWKLLPDEIPIIYTLYFKLQLLLSVQGFWGFGVLGFWGLHVAHEATCKHQKYQQDP